MKQVININFQGRVVPIEVTAFDILKNYTESLNRYFAAEEGKEEIINDIESRIGELFQERLTKGATCITDEDVNAIIGSMGRPEDFETEQAGPSGATTSAAENSYSYAPPPGAHKRLFRNENDKVIGGVCSGLATYFGVDTVVVRIIFVILAVSFGFGLIPYLILWIAVPSTASTQIGSTRKKLYRDPDDKFIAGVCSGIANYFGINSWIPRILFLLPFLSFVTRWNNWSGHDFGDFLGLSFSPGALIIYIILWLVIPEATTTTEKLEMKGEKVDMNSIKNSVMEEMKGVQQRAEKFGKEAASVAGDRARAFGSEAGTVVKRGSRGIGDIIAFLFKAFLYFIVGCIGFAFVVGLFALAVAAIGLFPLKGFVLNDGWQNVFAWGTLIFFIATPIIGIITWIIRRLAKIKTNRKIMRLSFTGLWILGIVCFIGLIISLSKDFRKANNVNEYEIALTNPGMSKLEVTSIAAENKYYRTRWMRIAPFEGLDEDTAMVKNVSIQIVKSTTDSFKVTVVKLADGPDKNTANRLAESIDFKALQVDSVLKLSEGIAINRTNKFRNQRVIVTIYVPVGKQIRVDRSMGWSDNVRLDGPWNDEWDLNFDNAEHGWDLDVDYIMTKDGLYTVKGNKPADEWRHRNDEDNNFNTDGTGQPDNYRYDQTKPATALDSLQLKLREEEKRTRDSLRKVKENVDEQLKRIEDKSEGNTSMNNYVLPGYNPLIMMMY